MENPIGDYYSAIFSHRETMEEALEYAEAVAKGCRGYEVYVMTAVMVVLNTAIKKVDESYAENN